MSSIIAQAGDNIAIEIADNMNGIARSKDNKEISELQMRNNNLLLSQHKLMNSFSGQTGMTLAGQDRSTVFPTKETQTQTQVEQITRYQKDINL